MLTSSVILEHHQFFHLITASGEEGYLGLSCCSFDNQPSLAWLRTEVIPGELSSPSWGWGRWAGMKLLKAHWPWLAASHHVRGPGVLAPPTAASMESSVPCGRALPLHQAL